MNYSEKNILDDREERALFLEKLIEEHKKPIISIRANYPGIYKNNGTSRGIVKELCKAVRKYLGERILFEKTLINAEGSTVYFAVCEDAAELKLEMVRLEEQHPLGRVSDIDVYDASFNQIGRYDLGLPKRKCFICGDYAADCVRSRKHDYLEVIDFIEETYLSGLSSDESNKTLEILRSMACRAMLYEASCYPAPGLISPVSKGAHKDMNYSYFLNSIFAVEGFLKKFAQAGFDCSSLEELFVILKKIEIEAENAMFEATNGINTLKGMIFLMAFGVGAASFAKKNEMSFKDIPSVIAEMSKYLEKQDADKIYLKKNITHGETAFIKTGALGVKGEVSKGLPTIFKYSLPYMSNLKQLSINDRLIQTLIYIMSICEDTNIIYRHSKETLEEVKIMSSDILSKGGMCSKEGREMILRFDKKLSNEGISPGGSADLLGMSIFFELLMRKWRALKKVTS